MGNYDLQLSLSLSRFPRSQRGFTLVELAIVLVIVGLLIGGILAAKSLIESAKINKVISDINQYSIAVTNFKTTYNVYPGDCPQCATWFGSACTAAINLNTCNGNGNGYIDGTVVTAPEFTRVFEHLYLAGILKIHYIPYSDFHAPANVVVPLSSISDANSTAQSPTNPSMGYVLYYISTQPSSGGFAGTGTANPGHWFDFVRSTNLVSTTGVVTPNIARGLDSKIDDGNPIQGNVRGINPSSLCIAAYSFHPCVNGSSGFYTTTSSDVTCNMSIKMINDF